MAKQIYYVSEFSSHQVSRNNSLLQLHLQVATTTTFCTFKMSFDFQPSCSTFGQMSSFDFHLQLYVQQQQANVFFLLHLSSALGLLLQQEYDKLQCRNVLRRSPT